MSVMSCISNCRLKCNLTVPGFLDLEHGKIVMNAKKCHNLKEIEFWNEGTQFSWIVINIYKGHHYLQLNEVALMSQGTSSSLFWSANMQIHMYVQYTNEDALPHCLSDWNLIWVTLVRIPCSRLSGLWRFVESFWIHFRPYQRLQEESITPNIEGFAS